LDNLNGAQLDAVIDAVRLSFDADQLAMLLRLHLDKKLDDLSEPGPWPERVFNVVSESQKQGFGRQLIEAVEVAAESGAGRRAAPGARPAAEGT
jgi:hypothetical protein